jgi:enamine deaminase RidA (YjgF/YER057c/UK114 family)
MTITHVNPDTMHKNPHFSQAVLAEGGRTLYIGEQNGVDAAGAIVPGGAKAQALAALDQLKKILSDVGADQSNVVRMTVYFSKDTPLDPIFEASNEAWGNHPTAITVLQVHALGRVDALVGIEAVALLP